MKILHITPDGEGYESVTLITNRISKKNGLAAIERGGNRFMTGGILLQDTKQIRKILDLMPLDEQYGFVRGIRVEPFVKVGSEEFNH